MIPALLDVAGIAISTRHYIDGERIDSAESFEPLSPIDQRLLPRAIPVGVTK